MIEATDTGLAQVLSGLREPQKRVSSKYHYDERGSRLFEDITRLDEYYLTRTERALLEEWMPALVSELAPRTLVELGAGNAEKSRVILEAMMTLDGQEVYVPLDVSSDFLTLTADDLRSEYSGLRVEPVVADIMDPLDLPRDVPRPMWIALLGSTIGNFDEPSAAELLRHAAAPMRQGDRLLLGADLRPGPKKTAERIELAYNDARGITAQFSLNILSVLNEEFGSNFDLAGFRHRSVYNAEAGRIETSLVSLGAQEVVFPGEPPITLREGEAIRSEISCKYDQPTIEALFGDAGLALDRWIEDDDGLYALILATRAES